MSRRVVLSGMGLITPCGIGNAPLWAAAREGRSGLSARNEQDPVTIPVGVCGFVRDFQPQQFVKNRKSLKVMCRDIQMAVVASLLAREDAGLGEGSIVPERSGTCIGAGVFEHDPEEMADSFRAALTEDGHFDARRFGSDGMGQLFPLWLLKYLPNMPACHITISHSLQGPSNTLTADSGGTASAIEEAIRVIRRGHADLMFAGGAECRLQGAGLLRYHAQGMLRDLSRGGRYEIFSARSGGAVIGEGGAILILEERSAALARGARIYAEVASFAVAADGLKNHDAAELSIRLEEVMRTALREAGVSPESVGGIFLSSRGLPREDEAEALAIGRVFGASAVKPVLVAAKPLTGFLGYAAAPVSLGLAAMMMERRLSVQSFEDDAPYLAPNFKFARPEGSASWVERPILVHHFEEGLVHHAFVLTSAGAEAAPRSGG